MFLLQSFRRDMQEHLCSSQLAFTFSWLRMEHNRIKTCCDGMLRGLTRITIISPKPFPERYGIGTY
jgi:hypothetical protein